MKHYKQAFIGLLFVLMSLSALAAMTDYKHNWTDPELEARYETLTYELRCPKCQNQNVADSDAPIAMDIRDKVAEMLKAGYTDREIVDFMVDRYTEFVTYKTRVNWRTIWIFLAPALLLLTGVLALFLRTRQKVKNVDLSSEQQEAVNQLLHNDK